MTRSLTILFAALLTLALAACDRAPSNAAPSSDVRIAPLSPAIAVILRDLDCADRIVGRHAFDMMLDKSLPVVGDQTGVDYESLARTNPTHILLDWGSRELPPRLLELAAERHWIVRDYRMLTLDDIRRATLAIAEDINIPGAPDRAAELVMDMDRAWTTRPAIAHNVGRALILFSPDGNGAAGPGSFHAELIHALGARNAVESGAPFVMLDAEDVRRLDPDSILIFQPDADPARWKELLGALARADLRAVAEGRVAVVAHPLGLTPSTAMIDVADEIERLASTWPPISNHEPDATLHGE